MANVIAVVVAAGGARAPNKRRDSSTTQEDVISSLRVSDAEVTLLATEYTPWRAQTDNINANFDVSYRSMFEFLTYLARCGYFHQLALARGIASSTAVAHLHSVADFFANTAWQHIGLPRPAELPALSSQLHAYNV